MRSILIGHTGFVGSNLVQQCAFTDKYNSKTIALIDYLAPDLVVCAGVQAKKWLANQEPEQDWAGIENLLGHLETVKAGTFVLISTVDVYDDPTGADEGTIPKPYKNHAYGCHRYRVEQFVRDTFPRHHIVRLPGLFGTGLKKNVIFDLLEDNCLEMVNAKSSYQYYPLDRLWADIENVLATDIRIINFATEPVPTAEIIEAYFPEKKALVGTKPTPEGHYDVQTKHARLFGKSGRYMMGKSSTLAAIERFVRDYSR